MTWENSYGHRMPKSVGIRSGIRNQQRRTTALEIKRNGSQPPGKGPAEWFTGGVRVDRAAQRRVVPTGREALGRGLASTAVTQIAIAEALNGKVVDWIEHVSDEQ